MPLKIRYWKKLERHPLSAEYGDLPPAQREMMRDRLKRFGILHKRAVIVHEDKVLDGWQLYQACIDEDVKPTFQPLPKGISAEEYVEIVNDIRRHENTEAARERAEARRARVLAARQEGQSIREIAEQEKVSSTTVHADLHKPGVQGEHLPTTIAGTDGKQYPATKPKDPELCPRCQRIGSATCNACRKKIAAKHAQEREPGDDTEAEEATKKKDKAARQRNGQPLFDWKSFDSHFGYVARAANEIGRAYPGEKNSMDFQLCEKYLKAFIEQFKKWQRRLERVKV